LISIHSLGHRPLDTNHPENRAILYEDITYSKRKIQDFLAALTGLKVANEIVQLFSKHSDLSSSSSLLNLIVYQDEKNQEKTFPLLDEILDYYTNAFSHTQARNEGKIIPTAGVCQPYDDSLNEIRENEKALNDYLNKQKKMLKNHDMKFVHIQKVRYALEIPENACRNFDDDYELMSSRKGFKRYYTSELRELIEQLTESEKKKESALKDTTSSLFRHFDSHHEIFQRVLYCLSTLDILLSFVAYSESYSNMCRPLVLQTEDNQQAFINIHDGKHPCMLQKATDSFIPNHIILSDKVHSKNELFN
jgi:DNA mismatch repair protein MSH6